MTERARARWRFLIDISFPGETLKKWPQLWAFSSYVTIEEKLNTCNRIISLKTSENCTLLTGPWSIHTRQEVSQHFFSNSLPVHPRLSLTLVHLHRASWKVAWHNRKVKIGIFSIISPFDSLLFFPSSSAAAREGLGLRWEEGKFSTEKFSRINGNGNFHSTPSIYTHTPPHHRKFSFDFMKCGINNDDELRAILCDIDIAYLTRLPKY